MTISLLKLDTYTDFKNTNVLNKQGDVLKKHNISMMSLKNRMTLTDYLLKIFTVAAYDILL